MKLYCLPLLAIVCLLFSCSLMEDPGKIKPPNWNPSFSIALLNTEISLEDGLNQLGESEYLEVDSAGHISLVYQSRIIEGQQFELIEIPDLSIPMLNSAQEFPFPASQVKRLDMKEGEMNFSFDSDAREPFTLTINIDALMQGGNDYQGTFDFGGAGAHSRQIDLRGMSIVPRQGMIRFGYEARRVSDGQLIALDNFIFRIQKVQYSYLEGYFGQQALELALDSVELSFGETAKSIEFNIAEPEIEFSISNSFGVPMEIQIPRLQVYQDGQTPIDLQSEELRGGLLLNHPDLEELGRSKKTDIRLDKDNSNLPQALSMIPDGISWSIGALVFPEGDSSQTGFVTDSSQLSVDLSARIPLKGSVSKLTFTQDLEVELPEVDILESAGLKMIVENAIPLGVSLQIYLMDENDQVLDSLFAEHLPLMSAAEVDANGHVSSASISDIDIDLSEEKLQQLFATSNFRIQALLATSQEGSVPVQFSTYNKLGIKMGVRARASLED